MRARILLAVLMLVATGGLARADDKPIDRAELDKRIVNTVYEVAVLGTNIFNTDKNYEGCYRLYQGTLITLMPMLDHRAKLQATVKLRLERAPSGLHLVGWLPDAADEWELAELADQHGVMVYPLSAFRLDVSSRRGLVLGFAAFGEAEIEEGVQKLARAWSYDIPLSGARGQL